MLQKSDPFGIIVTIMLSLANLCHLLWTFWLTFEQFQTGWGFGTNIELLVLLPWITEIILSPLLLLSLIYLVCFLVKREISAAYISTLSLAAALLLQFGLTNLFIFY